MEEMKKISLIEKYTVPSESNFFKLDANENLVLDKDFLTKISINSLKKTDLRKYPIELYERLYKKLSNYLDVSVGSLVLGSGSDQIIDLLLTLIGRGRRLTSIYPTFSYFKTRCQLHGIDVSELKLSAIDNSLDSEKFIEDAKKSHAAYLCSPNNPTGNQFEKSKILRIVGSLKSTLVIVDEAYSRICKIFTDKACKRISKPCCSSYFFKGPGSRWCKDRLYGCK